MAKQKQKPKRKRLKKTQLKQDSFVTYAVRISAFSKEHFNQISIGLVIIIAVIGFFLFTAHARRGAALEAERVFSSALQLYNEGKIDEAKKSFTELSDQYSRTQAGIISLYFKGECNLRLLQDSEAIAAYDAYLSKSGKFPLFRDAAMIGKSLALEGEGYYKDAAMTLDALLKQMDKSDPRYLSVAFRAGIFYSKTKDMQYKAKQFFRIVASEASGRMKEQAEVALNVLQGSGN